MSLPDSTASARRLECARARHLQRAVSPSPEEEVLRDRAEHGVHVLQRQLARRCTRAPAPAG